MFIYSKKIMSFIQEIKHKVKEILANELGLKIYGERFYNKTQTASYPIKIIIYNNKSMLGYFDSSFFELGFHERLMHVSKKKLHDIIKHEIAHYICFMYYGGTIQSHGSEYRAFCISLGWSEEIYAATICLESEIIIPDIEESSVLRKIQKLMALASSSNENEAQQAMIKSQQLLLKHNIDSRHVATENEEKVVLKRIMKQKKKNAKMRSIALILETFFVNIVFHRSGEYIYLEILGNAINIEIAEYVACVLDNEFENLWLHAKKNSNLNGMIAKNSFFIGLARGYCNKIQALKREYGSKATHAVMIIEKQLIDAEAMVYKRLSSTRSKCNLCHESSSLGELMGKQLNINLGIGKSPKNTGALIEYTY